MSMHPVCFDAEQQVRDLSFTVRVSVRKRVTKSMTTPFGDEQTHLDEVPPHLLHTIDSSELGRFSSSSSGSAGAGSTPGSASVGADTIQGVGGVWHWVPSQNGAEGSSVSQRLSQGDVDGGASPPVAESQTVCASNSRGTSLEVRDKQDHAAGGLGKRRLVRHPLKLRRGKRRQHAGQVADFFGEQLGL